MTNDEIKEALVAADRVIDLDKTATAGDWFVTLNDRRLHGEVKDYHPLDGYPLKSKIVGKLTNEPPGQILPNGSFIAETRTLAPILARAVKALVEERSKYIPKKSIKDPNACTCFHNIYGERGYHAAIDCPIHREKEEASDE